MAYSLHSDVANEFKEIDMVNGKITEAKVTEFISQADAYIDSRIGLIYTVPVTGVESLKVLKEISIDFVAQRIAYILETKSITPKGDQYVPKNLGRQAELRLQMIVDKKLLLSDADLISSTGGVSSYTGENTVNRAFRQGVNQW